MEQFRGNKSVPFMVYSCTIMRYIYQQIVAASRTRALMTSEWMVKSILSQVDEIDSNDIEKGKVKTMLLSIIGEMHSHA